MQHFSFKRLTAWLLTLMMVFSVIPVNVSASALDKVLGDITEYFLSKGDVMSAVGANISAATAGNEAEDPYAITPTADGTDPVVVIAGSDYQKSNSGEIMTNIMNQIKEDYSAPYAILMGGDYDAGDVYPNASHLTAVNTTISGVYSNIADENRIMIQGNHETYGNLSPSTNSLLDATGAHDTDYYGVYAINYEDFDSAASGLETYLNGKSGYTKPIFVMSHQPLHKTSRNDNNAAVNLFNVLNSYDNLNIIFLFGHNHSQGYDAYLGNGSIYLPKGSSITVAGGSTSTLNFTYMNYGYVGYVNGSADTTLTMSAFEITDTQVAVKRYDANGLHNLKAAGVTVSGYNTDSNIYGTAVIDLSTGESTTYALDASSGSTDSDTNTGTGGSGNVYTLDTDGIDAGEKYLIVSTGTDGEGSALTNSSGSSTGTTVNISGGKIELDNDNAVWIFTAAESGNIQNGTSGYYVYPSSTSGEDPVIRGESCDLNFTHEGNGEYTIQRDNTYAPYYVSSGSDWTYSSSEASVYLYKLTGSGTGTGGTVTPSGGDWKTISDGSGKVVYKLDKDGVDAGSKYLIVSDDEAIAMSVAANSSNGTAIEFNSDETEAYSTSTALEWTIETSDNGYKMYNTEGQYIGRSNSSISNDNSDVWSITGDGEGAYTIKTGSYVLRYSGSNSAFRVGSSSMYSNAIRLYKYDHTDSGVAEYAKIDGELTYTVARGTSAEEALAAVMNGVNVVVSADKSAETTLDDSDTNIKWTLASNYDGSTPGEYAVTISYKGVTLGTAKVIVPEATIVGYTLESYEGAVHKGASKNAETGAYIRVDVKDDEGEDYRVPVTVGMLSGDFTTSVMDTYEGLTVTYNGQTFENFTLTVNPKAGSQYPTYPDPGAVKVNKTASGIDFQASGTATVELSASGIPMNEGVDVVIVLDTSSSMSKYNKYPDENGTEMYRIELLRPAVNNLIQQMKTKREDGSNPDIDIAIVTFNGNTVKQDTNEIGGAGSRGTNYGIKTGDGSIADAWEKISEISSTWATDNSNANTPTDSGTNYDYGLQMAYDLLAQKKADSEGERQQFVLFLSDGSPSQYNGAESNDGVEEYVNWIRGNYDDTDEATDNDIPNINNPEFYTGFNNGNGQLHRSAEAIKAAITDSKKIIRFDTNGVGTLEEVDGLGATVYSIGLLLEDGSARSEDDQITVLETIASDSSKFFNIDSVHDLDGAFTTFATEVLLAATNARFVDEMGEAFDLQLTPIEYLPTGETANYETIDPILEVRSYEIYTRAEYEAGVFTDVSMIGTRKTNDDGSYKYETLEVITIESATEATSDQLSDENIIKEGVICGKYVWYNTNKKDENSDGTVMIDVDGDGTAETSLAAECFYWNIGDIRTTELALRYNVHLTGSIDGTGCDAGSYDTNGDAILYYNNYQELPCEKAAITPTMAWKGANVSYAFYLVDASSGMPVNNDGVEVPFSNRTVIVNPTLYDEIQLNTGEEDVESMEIAATGVLPAGYWLYDAMAHYTVVVNSNGTGSWTISGDDTLKNSNSTYVTDYDGDKYTNEDSNSLANDYTHTTVWFAVQWEPRALDDTVVIDYGLPVDVHVLTNDMFGKYGKLIGVTVDDVTDIASKTDNSVTSTSATGNFGTAVVDVPATDYNEANSVIRYTPTSMTMSGIDVFTYSVQYANPIESKNDGFYYGTLTIIPATSIYYEETFLTFINASGVADIIKVGSDGEAAVPGDWFTVGSRDDATQDEDRPGDINFAFDTVVDANNVYGYDSAYNNYTTYSLGAAEKVTVDLNIADKLEKAPHAQFTFKGSGFDIVSLTDNDSGVIKVTATGKDTGTTKSMLVNNYYGYSYGYLYDTNGVPMFRMADGTLTKKAYDANGNEYTTNELLAKVDENTGEVTIAVYDEDGDEMSHAQGFYVDEDAEGAIYQVPVIKMDLGVYDEYSVEIRVVYLYTQDMQKDETDSYSFWMDAVRIYDPANGGAADGTDDTTIEDAYKEDKEAYPEYLLIKESILDSVVKDESGAIKLNGAVFIDGVSSTESVDKYENPGPNNEAYLAYNQGISFKLVKPDDRTVAGVQIGMKLANVSTAAVENGFTAAVAVIESLDDTTTYNLNTATDRYYDLDIEWNDDNTSNVITIRNTTEDVVVSLTNIKITYTEPADTGVSAASFLTDDEVVETALFLMRAPVSEVFVPETFEADYSSNRNGKNVTVTVTASTDVEVITINGIEMSRYKEKKGVRTWTYKPKNNELADLYEIVAFNADGLASEPIYAGSENTDDLLGAETYINRMSQKVVKKLQKDMEKLANRIFTPEKFNKKLEKLADGAELMVVNTSEDVEYIIADGEILRNYITETIIDLSKDGEETVNRVWLVPNADDNAEIAAYNAEGVASEGLNNG